MLCEAGRDAQRRRGSAPPFAIGFGQAWSAGGARLCQRCERWTAEIPNGAIAAGWKEASEGAANTTGAGSTAAPACAAARQVRQCAGKCDGA